MNVARLIRADAKALLRSLPVLMLILGLFSAAVYFSLPRSILQRGEEKVTVSVALVGIAHDSELAAPLYDVSAISRVYTCSEDEADRLLRKGSVSVVLVFPPDTIERIMDNQTVKMTVKTNNEVIGSFFYPIVAQTVASVNRVFDVSGVFSSALRQQPLSPSARDRAQLGFDLALLSQALQRSEHIQSIFGYSVWQSIILALLSLALVSLALIAVLVTSATQRASGYFRRLRLRGVSNVELFLSKLCLTYGIVLSLSLPLMVLLALLKVPLDPLRYGATVLLLTSLIAPLSIALFLQTSRALRTSTIIVAGGSVFFLCLLLGQSAGSASALRPLMHLANPSWIADGLTGWSLGGLFPHNLWYALIVVVALTGMLLGRKRREIRC